MQSLNVVLYQSDPGTALSLIAPLSNSFSSVREARSLDDVRTNVAKHRAQVVILDMELASLTDLAELSHDFPGVSIVCNHRLADEQLWTEALGAGAVDFCPSYDTRSILQSAQRHASRAHSRAA
jgi:DNA-binding NarL/FixJ family response regulator